MHGKALVQFSALFCFSVSCRTTSENDYSSEAQATSIGGVFANDDTIQIKVPEELNQLIPNTNSSPAFVNSPSSLQGPGFSGHRFAAENAKTNAKTKESILLKCFQDDGDFRAEGWVFFAELEFESEAQKVYAQQDVNGCTEMQLSVLNLDRAKSYVVRASFYWYSDETKQTVVWYEGATKPFKLRDENRMLILRKVRQD